MAYHPKYDYLNDEEELKKIIEEHKKAGSLIEIKDIDLANILKIHRFRTEIFGFLVYKVESFQSRK